MLDLLVISAHFASRLAAIQFTGYQAESKEFERDIYPEVEAVTRNLGLVDPVMLFVQQ